jgi:hypothetical protein
MVRSTNRWDELQMHQLQINVQIGGKNKWVKYKWMKYKYMRGEGVWYINIGGEGRFIYVQKLVHFVNFHMTATAGYLYIRMAYSPVVLKYWLGLSIRHILWFRAQPTILRSTTVATETGTGTLTTSTSDSGIPTNPNLSLFGLNHFICSFLLSLLWLFS